MATRKGEPKQSGAQAAPKKPETRPRRVEKSLAQPAAGKKEPR